jgi:hypothetical protein
MGKASANKESKLTQKQIRKSAVAEALKNGGNIVSLPPNIIPTKKDLPLDPLKKSILILDRKIKKFNTLLEGEITSRSFHKACALLEEIDFSARYLTRLPNENQENATLKAISQWSSLNGIHESLQALQKVDTAFRSEKGKDPSQFHQENFLYEKTSERNGTTTQKKSKTIQSMRENESIKAHYELKEKRFKILEALMQTPSNKQSKVMALRKELRNVDAQLIQQISSVPSLRQRENHAATISTTHFSQSAEMTTDTLSTTFTQLSEKASSSEAKNASKGDVLAPVFPALKDWEIKVLAKGNNTNWLLTSPEKEKFVLRHAASSGDSNELVIDRLKNSAAGKYFPKEYATLNFPIENTQHTVVATEFFPHGDLKKFRETQGNIVNNEEIGKIQTHAKNFIGQICELSDTLVTKGTAHTDIKLSNFLVKETNGTHELQVSDCKGIKEYENIHAVKNIQDATQQYQAPECLQKPKVAHDLEKVMSYSIGMALYTFLTGNVSEESNAQIERHYKYNEQEQGYAFISMRNLPSDKSRIQTFELFIDDAGNYAILDRDRNLKEGKITDDNIDFTNFKQKLDDPEFKKAVLANISSQGVALYQGELDYNHPVFSGDTGKKFKNLCENLLDRNPQSRISPKEAADRLKAISVPSLENEKNLAPAKHHVEHVWVKAQPTKQQAPSSQVPNIATPQNKYPSQPPPVPPRQPPAASMTAAASQGKFPATPPPSVPPRQLATSSMTTVASQSKFPSTPPPPVPSRQLATSSMTTTVASQSKFPSTPPPPVPSRQLATSSMTTVASQSKFPSTPPPPVPPRQPQMTHDPRPPHSLRAITVPLASQAKQNLVEASKEGVDRAETPKPQR